MVKDGYLVKSFNIMNNKIYDYGIVSREKMEKITKGYHWDGYCYSRKDSNKIFVVTEYIDLA